MGSFVNGRLTFGDKDATIREQGFGFISGGVTAGADYRFTDNRVLGIALSYTHSHADINFNLGETISDGYGISAYGSYYMGNFYVDGHAGFEWNEIRRSGGSSTRPSTGRPEPPRAASSTQGISASGKARCAGARGFSFGASRLDLPGQTFALADVGQAEGEGGGHRCPAARSPSDTSRCIAGASRSACH